MDQSAETNGSEKPPQKRRRIALACSACRTRKSKCDGARPTCSTCQTLDFSCEYEPSISSTNVIVRRDYVSELEGRVKRLEQAFQRHDNLLTGHLSSCSRLPASSFQRPQKATPEAIHSIQLDANGLQDPEDDDSRTDGLALTFVDEHAPAYFGESSNVAFTRYLLKAISAVWRVRRPETPAGAEDRNAAKSRRAERGVQASSTIERRQSLNLSATELPPPAEMESLIDFYFNGTGLLFPFIHEATFRSTYQELQVSGFSKVRRTWLGLLNMMMAMGSFYDLGDTTSAKDSFERSHTFYSRAVAVCDGLSKRSPNLEIVQYLLLVVLHLQGAQRSTEAWAMHGLLVRAALALGLHVNASWLDMRTVQQESGRRTWLTIYCLDSVLSATFGRPAAIPVDSMAFEGPAPWPYAQNLPKRPPNPVAELAAEYLGVAFELYKIMGQSLVVQYKSNLGELDAHRDTLTTIQSVAAMRHELLRWASTLPPNLKILASHSDLQLDKTMQNTLRVTLTLRYHNISILIHRPLMCAMLRSLSSPDAALESHPQYSMQLAMAEARDCIISAEQTIDLVHADLAHAALTGSKAGNNNLGVWFFNLYYGKRTTHH